METLRKKVTEVHSCFADAELSSTSTLEKLAFIENHMTKLLQDLEKIPKDEVKSLWQIKEKEKRSRSIPHTVDHQMWKCWLFVYSHNLWFLLSLQNNNIFLNVYLHLLVY